jgi:putative ABC transport system substrate-binding protein
MRRREFITLLGSATAWPLAAGGQQPAGVPVIGFLHSGWKRAHPMIVNAFRQGLSDAGYAEGHNVAIDFRWADTQFARLPGLAVDLVKREVTVLVSGGGLAAVRAEMAATQTIPIVAVTSADLVKYGLVASLNRPGGNVTGLNRTVDRH